MEERIRFHSGPYRLEGLLDRSTADRGVVITHPHPLYGGDMDNFVVKIILDEYRKKGYTTLRFNFRGVGDSSGVYDEEGRGVQTDVRAAIAYLYAQGIKEVELAGYSFGAWVNAHMDCKAEKIHRMLMVSPPVDLLDFETVQPIPCPCLVVCGDKDEFASADKVRKMIARCHPDAVLEIIPHCNHFYSISLNELENFLKKHLEPCKKVAESEKIYWKTGVDLKRFFRVCNPAYPLDIAKEEDRKYYTDFSSVRSGTLIREIKRTIILSEKPAAQFFTGHKGSGKSTELLRLRKELEDDNYHAVCIAFDSEKDRCDLRDLLRSIVQKVSESLTEKGIAFDSELSDLTEKTDKTESEAARIIDRVNREFIGIAGQKLKEKGKNGLVIIADGLEHVLTQNLNDINNILESLKNLACHTILTVPLRLMYSNESENLKSGFSVKPKMVAMVPVLFRNGETYEKGLYLLKQTVMTRAFPDADEAERMKMADAVFEKPEMLETICLISGGSVRTLMHLLFACLQKQDPPFSQNILEEVLREDRDDLMRKIRPEEKDRVQKIMKNQFDAGEKEYESLVRNLVVFEYQDKDGIWFGLNPLLNL